MTRTLDGKVLVTGGSGFIGAAVLTQLAASGASIRMLIPPHEEKTTASCKFESIIADVRDRERVREALLGIKYVFHIAGDYRLWAKNPGQMFSVNVEGAQVIMEEALSANVSCIMHTSSASTVRQNKEKPADETSLAEAVDADGPYMKSKILADLIVRDMIQKRNLPVITLKPTTVIGPGDYRPTPTGQLVLNAVRGAIPAYVDTKLNITHVNDVARGFILAFRNGLIGRDYILGGDNVSLQTFLIEVSKEIGTAAPRWRLPASPLLPLAYANEFRCRLVGDTPFLTVAGLTHARRGLVYNTDRARAELGYTSRPFAETVQSAVVFFVERVRGAKANMSES